MTPWCHYGSVVSIGDGQSVGARPGVTRKVSAESRPCFESRVGIVEYGGKQVAMTYPKIDMYG